ncbi:hypothetical protein B0H14DRAFT_2653906 [Mycena olivaceomarginata]|nr:hypothetical protein B0H14DRAFT_2653906 [Mycena olivaceomarginata]
MAIDAPPLAPVAPRPCVLDWKYQSHTIPRDVKIQSVIHILKSMSMSPMDLVTSVLVDSNTFSANIDGFYRGTGLEQFLNVVSQDKRGMTRLFLWFERHSMQRLIHDIHHEMDDLSRIFLRSTKDITPEAILDFDFEDDITEACRECTPKLRSILTAAAQTPRAARENTVKDIEPAQLAKTRSQNNNLCAIPCSLYFLSSGMPRKVIDTLAHAGMCLSYNVTKDTHSTLAVGQLRRAQLAARMGHSVSWDNTNLSLSIHVEQRALAPPKVQTGTTQLIYNLRGLSDPATLELKPILQRRVQGELITFTADIRPTHSQYEGSTEGSTLVNENIYLDQLDFDLHDLDNIAVPSYNDQKTNALIRSAQLLRMDDLSAILRLEQLQPAPGAFHTELNLSWMLLKVHRGDGADLGSLQYFIGLLTKVRLGWIPPTSKTFVFLLTQVLTKVRLGSDHPDFETLVSLLTQVLTGAMLHYWEIETGMSITQLANSKPTASRLLEIAGTIFHKYASGAVNSPPNSDYTTRNLHLLMRDTLVFYLLRTSISSGDFGRVELLLGTLTMMFSGGGCTKLPDRASLLPAKFEKSMARAICSPDSNLVRDNALITTSGHGYVGVDKNAEFNINFQKGVHASWVLLGDLAPNVPILRRLKTQFGQFLGAPWQGTHHTKVECSDQINKVKLKMREYRLHLPSVAGRRVTERETTDVVENGSEVLRKSAMKSWSKAYKTWVNGG